MNLLNRLWLKKNTQQMSVKLMIPLSHHDFQSLLKISQYKIIKYIFLRTNFRGNVFYII